jgi:aminopeptidase N
VRFLAFFCLASVCGMAAEPGVSRQLAIERARAISNVRYHLDLSLKEHSSILSGHEAIDFNLSEVMDPLVIDFRDLDPGGKVVDGKVDHLVVNGVDSAITRGNGHLLIAASALKQGANHVDLDFESIIADAGRAVTRYKDVQDDSEYLYTLFVPMDASLAFPCFDQPDLKARFTLRATAPSGWTVISNGTAKSSANHIFAFSETKPISTYLFAFAAGPFREIPGSGASVPTRLFVRKSVIERAREEWPEVEDFTRQGMARMSTFFEQPFPFPKYDQVLIPGLAYGGMEHAGATFLREDVVIFRTAPTISDHHRRSVTVLHELAHQWFGDLVTMRWFDDLWLKEGFAQYMAFHTLAELEPPNEVWTRFYESIKPIAYGVDSTRGTTPIYQQIRNLSDAKSAYGPIVYQKAPSLLRVLSYRIGENGFRDGVRLYLRQHAYANAEWKDLIGAFSKASGQDLGPWAAAWIQQRGMPEVTVEWTCDGNNRVGKFVVSQRDVLDEKHVWPVETEVLLGYRNDLGHKLKVTFSGASTTVPAALGKSCPDYVFGNNDDHAYGRFVLDDKSRATIVEDLARVQDPLLRALLWGALWDSVREAQMAPVDFIKLVVRSGPTEKDLDLTQTLLGRMRTAFVSYLSEAQQNKIADEMQAMLMDRMKNASTVDLRITFFRVFTASASGIKGTRELRDLLAGTTSIPGVPLKQRDRWNMLATLVRNGDAEAMAMVAAESARDKSDDGRKSAYAAGAGLATAENKDKYFDDYLRNKTVQEDWVTASLGDFNAWNQTALTMKYLKPALEALPQMKRERKIFFVNGWLSSFVGSRKSPEALEIVNQFLGGNLDPDLRLKVLEVKDELERTVRIRATYGS